MTWKQCLYLVFVLTIVYQFEMPSQMLRTSASRQCSEEAPNMTAAPATSVGEIRIVKPAAVAVADLVTGSPAQTECPSGVATIKEWYGRFGNNVNQVLHALHYAVHHNLCRVTLPTGWHQQYRNDETLFLADEINVTSTCCSANDKNRSILDLFFEYHKMLNKTEHSHIPLPTLDVMRELAQQYIVPILTINLKRVLPRGPDEIGMHVRSGDMFARNPHPLYVPVPLYFYVEVLKNYSKSTVVYEDAQSPLVAEMKKMPKMNLKTYATFEKVLLVLSSFQNLAFGFGTFGTMAFYLSPNIKRLYVPDYFVPLMPVGSDRSSHVTAVSLPGYIPVLTWHNTKQQRWFMLHYTPPSIVK